MKQCFVLLFCAAILSACAGSKKEEEAEAVFSEGVDTPVEVTGYTAFPNDSYFLKKGDRIAVISPSSLPSEKQKEETLTAPDD